MIEYTLSVVQLCPDAYRAAANAIAEASGFGPGNLSVELRGPSDSVWWGCHAWWVPEVYEAMTAPTGDPDVDGVLAQVITSVREGGDPMQHWQEALAEHGLSVYAPESEA